MMSLFIFVAIVVVMVLVVIVGLRILRTLSYWLSIFILPIFAFHMIQQSGYEALGFVMFLVSGLTWAHLVKRIQKRRESLNKKDENNG